MCVSKYSIKNCCMLSFLFCDQLLMTIWVQNMGLQWYDSQIYIGLYKEFLFLSLTPTQGEVYSIQPYVIKFVSDLYRGVNNFLHGGIKDGLMMFHSTFQQYLSFIVVTFRWRKLECTGRVIDPQQVTDILFHIIELISPQLGINLTSH